MIGQVFRVSAEAMQFFVIAPLTPRAGPDPNPATGQATPSSPG
jgi:hypothetical protein